MRTVVVTLGAALLLAGCQTTSAEVAKKPTSEMNKCELVGDLLANQWATPAQQAAALEIGRNEGCFGRSQTRNVDVTVRTGQ